MAQSAKKTQQQQFEAKLGAALVNRGDITKAELQEAIQNQVLMGGQLTTNLWELGIASTDKCTEYACKLLKLKAVPEKVVAKTPKKILKIFPRKFVVKNRIIPLGVKNRELSVATCEPWNLAALDEAAFTSGLRIKHYFMAEVPLVKMMDHLYEIPASGRFRMEPMVRQRFVPQQKPKEQEITEDLMSQEEFEKLHAGQEEQPKSVADALASLPKKKGADPARTAVSMPPDEEAPKPEEPAKPAQPPAAPEKPAAPAPPSEQPPAPSEPPPAPEPPVAEVIEDAEPIDDEFADIVGSEEDLDEIIELVEEVGVEEEETAAELEAIHDVAEAQALLEAATDRDELGEILVRFAMSKGARAVLFTRTADLWMGWIGAGPGVQSEFVKALMFPSESGTCFGLVAQTDAHFMGPLQPHVIHDRLLKSLGGQTPAGAGLFPVHYRGKVVFGIYMDGGEGQHIDPNIADILLLALKVPMAIERLIEAKQAA